MADRKFCCYARIALPHAANATAVNCLPYQDARCCGARVASVGLGLGVAGRTGARVYFGARYVLASLRREIRTCWWRVGKGNAMWQRG